MPLYSPEQEIGHGGMGAVYKIHENGCTVAVKMMSKRLLMTLFIEPCSIAKSMP